MTSVTPNFNIFSLIGVVWKLFNHSGNAIMTFSIPAISLATIDTKISSSQFEIVIAWLGAYLNYAYPQNSNQCLS